MNINKEPKGSFHIKLPLLLIIITSFFFNNCNEENPGEFTLGDDLIESPTNLSLIDTFSVQLSTVIIDSVQTSGTGSMLIGCFDDDIFGKIISHSYFQVMTPDNFDVERDDEFDSLDLVISYNQYFFGDTTKPQKISVHQLTENIEFNEDDDEEVITSGISFDYNPEPIGSIVYYPRPNKSSDTLTIRISDDIGLDLFEKLKDGSEIMTDTERFISYFHGLVLIADDAYEGSIIGFEARDEAAVSLVMYTTSYDLTKQEIIYEFEMENTDKQFNNIVHDFSSTQLSNLVEQRSELPSSETGGVSYLLGGIGVMLRVDFPSLGELLLLERGKIIEAQLSLAPLQNSFDDESELPSNLIVYDSDKLNRRNNLLYNGDGYVVQSTLVIDELYHEEDAFLFDVTEFINDELEDSYVDPEKGLLVTLPLATLRTTFGRLIVDAEHKNTKLKIYYLSY
ncbi:MAG: DUF4270 family protein [Ignavibacteria bacterium]|jgi:hypothetical protein